MKQKPEKLQASTAHLQQTPAVLGLLAAILRLRARKARQMELRLKGKA